VDKHSKKRQPDSSKIDKNQAGTSKQETYARECVEDEVPTPTTPVLNKSKWWKESPRPATLETLTLIRAKTPMLIQNPNKTGF
ncbi:hypothetical protein Tco_0310070, partial [Tanacetum coccineum]